MNEADSFCYMCHATVITASAQLQVHNDGRISACYIRYSWHVNYNNNIYHALTDALSTHIMHINLNTVFYSHVEQNPTNALHIKYCLKQKTTTG